MLQLSIVIPTYIRAEKLVRLLKNIENEIYGLNLDEKINVLVSDNASTDNTQILALNYKTEKFNYKYFRQEKNLGFDGNIRFLYDISDSEYVWFFSDDDILLPGAVVEIQKRLKETNPDVLLFSFIQPIGSEYIAFDLPESVSVITNQEKIIRYIAQYPKISIYICRKIKLTEEQQIELMPFYENGFFWIDLCYTVIKAAGKPSICIISKPLASCDDDFHNIRFSPSIFLKSYTIYLHPFVHTLLPNMAKESRITSYFQTIQLMFAVEMGSLKSDDPSLIKKEIRDLPLLTALLKCPKALLQILALKLNIVFLYKIYKSSGYSLKKRFFAEFSGLK